jgi:nucleoside-diphosphate-sugar epimerase
MKKTISILGAGWLGKPLALSLAENGYTVRVSTTTGAAGEELTQANIPVYQVLISEDEVVLNDPSFFSCDVLIINFPPGRSEEKASRHPQQIRLLTKLIRKHAVPKILFVSSTSVYPDCNSVVDESCSLPPDKASGRALLEAEHILREESGARVTVLRFAGLIGYDRLPARFLAGKKELRDGKAPVNLIHRDDCIGAIEAILNHDAFGEIFNGVCDQHPLREEFYIQAAKNAGLPLPEFLNVPSENWKTVSGEKLKSALNYTYIHPDPMLLI